MKRDVEPNIHPNIGRRRVDVELLDNVTGEEMIRLLHCQHCYRYGSDQRNWKQVIARLYGAMGDGTEPTHATAKSLNPEVLHGLRVRIKFPQAGEKTHGLPEHCTITTQDDRRLSHVERRDRATIPIQDTNKYRLKTFIHLQNA